jgi:predicted CopG family antitoxin
MAKGYRQISIPDPLYEQVLKFLKKHPEYSSVADLVKELLRDKIKPEK